LKKSAANCVATGTSSTTSWNPIGWWTLREIRLGPSGAFADIKVSPADTPPYFVEIKWGYDDDEFIERLAEKYATRFDAQCGKLIIVTESIGGEENSDVVQRLKARLDPTLQLVFWPETEILSQIDEFFGLRLESLSTGNYQAIRDAIVAAEWRLAFGSEPDYGLALTLFWHFSPWRLRRIHRELGLAPDQILRPDRYKNVIIVMADLCSFSSYVRDTRDDADVRQALTPFYSQARQAVLESGGMMDKFVGDEVMGIFGFPAPTPDYAENALQCAHRLVDIGRSVSEHWQARLDRLQHSGGVHVGIAIGDLNLMPLRPFSRYHVGFIGDAVNLTARLMSSAGPSEIVISNRFHHALDRSSKGGFKEIAPAEAKNMGLIKSWRWNGASDFPDAA
jgi:class 3 adenylate cyclase